MKLIVLGSSASYALPSEATSGYIIQSEDQSIAIDLGTGALSNLFRWQDPADLDALILSHLHMDHFADIYPLRLYLNFDRPDKKLTVYAPENAAEQLKSVLSPKGKEIFERVLRFKKIEEKKINVSGFKITFLNMVHDIDSYAMRIEHKNKALVYTSDTAYNDKLVKLATGVDLLLAEATLSVPIKDVRHMTVADAASLANEAGVKKLVLTHIWPTFKDENTVFEARKYFSKDIHLAEANMLIDV